MLTGVLLEMAKRTEFGKAAIAAGAVPAPPKAVAYGV